MDRKADHELQELHELEEKARRLAETGDDEAAIAAQIFQDLIFKYKQTARRKNQWH